jgi:hypothetical protein
MIGERFTHLRAKAGASDRQMFSGLSPIYSSAWYAGTVVSIGLSGS